MPRAWLTVASEQASLSGGMVSRLLALGDRLVSGLPATLVTVVLAWVIIRLAHQVIGETIRRVLERRGTAPREVAVRLQTLASVTESAVRLVVLVVAGMTVLNIYGVPIGPLLASAGVAGIAVGFGAQSLIRDVIGGFFLILEGHFLVGDVVTVGSVTGTVEVITLRYTAIRGQDGALTVVPNGDIRTVTNLTRDWARAMVDVTVPLDAGFEAVLRMVQQALQAIADDPDYAPALLGPGEIVGVEQPAAQQVTVRVAVRTRPMERWRVQQALRLRIVRALAQAGVPGTAQGAGEPVEQAAAEQASAQPPAGKPAGE